MVPSTKPWYIAENMSVAFGKNRGLITPDSAISCQITKNRLRLTTVMTKLRYRSHALRVIDSVTADPSADASVVGSVPVLIGSLHRSSLPVPDLGAGSRCARAVR